MPVYKAPKKVHDSRVRMVVGRDAYITQGSSTNNQILSELVPENRLWMHPEPAKRLGLGQDDTVEVSSAVEQNEELAQRIRQLEEEYDNELLDLDSGDA